MTGHMTLVAQQGADSISTIDQEVGAVEAISVDTSVLPQLGQDVQALKATLSTWTGGLRAQAQSTLQALVNDDTAAEQRWAAVDKSNVQAMLGFAEDLRGQLTADEQAIETLGTALAGFRGSADQALARLNTDLQAVNRQIANEQAMANTLAAQVKHQRDKIEDYKKHPWKLILAGLSLPLLIKDLVDMENALKRASAAMSELHKVQARLTTLQNAQGPLLRLSTALTVLGGSVSNVQTAVDQVSSKLTTLMSDKPAAPIIAAELQALVSDLESADQIAKEVLA